MDERTGSTAATTETAGSTTDDAQPRASGYRPEAGEEHSAAAGGAATATESEAQAVAWGLRLDCLRLSSYHHFRRQFLDTCHRWVMFLVIIAGAGVTSRLLADFEATTLTWLALVPVFAATLDLVFRFSDRARDHEALYRQYVRLLGQIVAEPNPDPPLVAAWQQDLHEAYATAPPNHFTALDAWCYNLACQSLGVEAGERLVVPWLDRRLRHLLAFNGKIYPAVKDRRRR